MNVILILLLIVIVLFIIYVVYSLNSRGFRSYYSNDIWKSSPGKYENFTSSTTNSTLSASAPIVENPKPINGQSYNQLDPYGLIPSSMDCEGSSYYTLNGNICLNKEQKMLLTTRGGNSKTGTPYETA